MLFLQRPTAALTGVLLLAASLSVGASPASAETTPTTSTATAEAEHSSDAPASPAATAPAETAPAEEGPAANAANPFPGGMPPHEDHTFEGSTSEEGTAHSREGAAMSPLGAGGTLSRQGDIKVRLVTVKLANSSATVPATAARDSITVSSRYWKSMSNGRLSMSIGSEKLNHVSAARTTDSYDAIMNQVTKELGWSYSPYTALVVFVPMALNEGYLGYGWSSNGTSGRILMPYTTVNNAHNFTTNVVTHEFGHVLGLMHSDSLECASGQPDTASFTGTGCSIRHYGDTSDLMGISRWFETPVISSSFWDYGGFGRGDEIRDVGVASGRQTYTLLPWAGTAANRALKFTDPRSLETYFLELRVPVGFDKNLAVGGNRGVKVVQSGGLTPASSLALMPSSKPYAGYYASNTAWQAGSVFTTHAGTTVRINSVSDSSATVTIDANSTAATTPSTTSSGRSDLNGDGNPDVVARDSAGKLWLYPSNASGTFTARTQIGSGWGGMNTILLPGDFNGDGNSDILARDNGGRLWLYPGNGRGGVTSGQQIGSGWGGMTALVTPGDFNGDGKVDVLARTADGALHLYPGNGRGGWGVRTQPGAGWNGMNALVSTGDFNGDGHSDVLARSTSGALYLYPGNGRGGFLAGSQPGAGWNGMNALVGPGAWGADANTDLIARNSNGDLYLYSGNGAGRFSGSMKIGSGWGSMYIAQ